MAARPPARKTPARKKIVEAELPPVEDVDAALDVLAKSPEELETEVVDEDDQPIPDDLQFSTADREPVALTDADFLEFAVDGQALTAIRPDAAMWTILLASLSNAATVADRSQAIMAFVDHTLDDESKMYVRHRLSDRKDAFDTELLAKIIDSLITYWAPKPNRAERRRAAQRR